MKLLILDHLKRWWYLWLLIGGVEFLFFGMSSNLAMSPTPFTSLPTIVTFQLIYFAGVFPLSYDLQRGHSRALMALPVSARQIGRAWWFVSVGIPAVLLAMISGLGLAMLIYSGEATKGFDGGSYLAGCITNALWLGVAFFLLSKFLDRQPQSPADYARRVIFFGVLVFCIFGVVRFGDLSPNTTEGIIFMLIAAVLTIAGWFRAEHLVLQRAGARAASQRSRKGPAQYKVQAGFGGLPFLYRNLITRFCYLGLLYLGLMILIMMMMKTMTGGRLSPKQLVEAIIIPLNTFSYFFVLMFLLLPTITHLRFLRTLPISSAALAAALVFLPTASIIGFGMFIAVLKGATSGSSAGLMIPQSFFIGSGLLAMSVPMFVWRGLAMESFLVLFLIVMGGNLSPMFFHLDKAPPWAIISVSSLLVALAFYLTRRLLVHSSQSYRVRPMALNAWGMATR